MLTNFRGHVAAALAWVLAMAAPLHAQMDMDMEHDMHLPEGPLGVPETRLGSGTSWLPDASPMHAAHLRLGAWTLMLHGSAVVQYDHQAGLRGDSRVSLIDWVMLAPSRPVAGGRLHLRGMISSDPWGVGSRGYPLLLQTGESDRGVPLHDHQHPHDLFMELAALYERAVARNLAVSLYAAPVGEPAVGPAAFPHRPSAADDPLAPLAHHWQDGTHITFGVLTAGVFTRTTKLEASIFNGREPDEDRTNFDYAGRALDSYSARLSVNPGAHWSVSTWYAYLKSPETLHPDESLHRLGAAALMAQPIGRRGRWAMALIYGANARIGTGHLANSVAVETNFDLDGMNAVFGRVEYVRKTAEDLVVLSVPPATEYDVGALALGYHRTFTTVRGVAAGGVPAARAAATALASRAPLGLHQGERLPALARAPLDPAPPIGYSPIGEQALLAREARHAAICLVAGIPATSPRGQICSVTRLVAIAVLTGLPPRLAAQSPHAANPERPSVATHAYTVAPGYAELEQGVRAQGRGNVRDQTSWEFNLKIGVARPPQLGLFGTGYNRTGQGNGVGDVGVALKLRRDLSSTHEVALVPAVTLPTGDQSLGLGEGRGVGGGFCGWSFGVGGVITYEQSSRTWVV